MGILSGPKPQIADVRHGGSTPPVLKRAYRAGKQPTQADAVRNEAGSGGGTTVR